MTNLEIATAAASIADLDEACAFVQDHFGQSDGGLAGMFFDHEEWNAMGDDKRLERMLSYVAAEANAA